MVEQATQSQDGVSKTTPSLQSLLVQEISPSAAKEVILKYHYSGKMPGGKMICFGYFVDGKLYAVSVYGQGVNRNSAKFLQRKTKLSVDKSNFLELMRLARVEPKIESAPLTKFLALCHKHLLKRGYKYILSYSDPEFNPAGGIYAATNFILLGMSQSMPRNFTDMNGKRKSWRGVTAWRKKHDVSIEEAIQALGLVRSTFPSKKQWFLALVSSESSQIAHLDTRPKIGKSLTFLGLDSPHK